MCRSLVLLFLLFAVTASPGAILAQTPTHGSPGLPASALLGADPPSPAGAATIWSVVALPDPGAATDRPYASDYVSTLRYDGQPRTAVDYRFAPDGLVGSVGYLRVDDDRRLDSHQVGMAASSRFVSLVGATLSYAFR